MGKSIGYVVPGAGISGGLIVVLEHANRLIDRGHGVFLINISEDRGLDWYPDNKAPVYWAGNPYPARADVLVATGWETAYRSLTLDIEARRRAYFVQSDESRFFPDGYLEKRLAYHSYNLPFEYLTEARWIQDWLADKFGQEALYAPNALNEKLFYPTEPLEPRRERLRILLEGPINWPLKGMDDAFRAVEGLGAEIWCVSSDGRPRRGQWCDRFFEGIPLKEMKKIYSSCDVLLKMSRVEGFFVPPLEMMACGGTVVTTRVTGWQEYIIDGYNALTVEISDHRGARNALRKLMEDRELLDRLKKGGAKTAASMKWDKTIDTLEDFYGGDDSREALFSSSTEEKSSLLLAEITERLFVDFIGGKLKEPLLCLSEKEGRIGSLQRDVEDLKSRKKHMEKRLLACQNHISELENSRTFRIHRFIQNSRIVSFLERVFLRPLERLLGKTGR